MAEGVWTLARGVIDFAAVRIARELTPELVAGGAQALVLSGSFARGDAHPESDIDIIVLGAGPGCRLRRHDGYLVSLSWQTPEQVRDSFLSPTEVGATVPGWRRAIPIHDPQGVAAALIEEAMAWTWDGLDARCCDGHVAEGITGLAEEVHKLAVSLEVGRRWPAAVQRSVLALRLAGLLALHYRMLYETENRLWDLVAGRMPPAWARSQAAALCDSGQDFRESCIAALQLYSLAVAEVRHLLDSRQLAVVSHACALGGYPLARKGEAEAE